jgi:hypothetical protein
VRSEHLTFLILAMSVVLALFVAGEVPTLLLPPVITRRPRQPQPETRKVGGYVLAALLIAALTIGGLHDGKASRPESIEIEGVLLPVGAAPSGERS